MSSLRNVSVIGIGRLGLCFALSLESKGFHIVGVDIDPAYVQRINDKTLSSYEPGVEGMLQRSRNFVATTNLEDAVRHSDLLFVLVDTPSTGDDRHYDHSKLSLVLRGINALKPTDAHIVIGCTVLPGYICNEGLALLSYCRNCSLSYNPEFIAQGNIIQGQLCPDMVLIGEGSKQAGDRIAQLYMQVCENQPRICRMSPASAEICKLALNCFVTMKIAYANLIGDIADLTPNANKHEICDAVGCDSRIGAKCLKPGYGFGGPCFPRDNRALGGYAASIHVDALLFKATDACNKQHALFQTQQMLSSPNDSFLFTNVAYKENTKVPIIEESQKLAIAAGLARSNKRVTIRDNEAVVAEVRKLFGSLFEYEIA